MSSYSISFLMLACLILVSAINAEQANQQQGVPHRDLHTIKSSKRHRDWMSSGSQQHQRQFNSKFGKRGGPNEAEYFFQKEKKDNHHHSHHHHEGMAFDKAETVVLERIKEAIESERDARPSSSSSWRSPSSSSKSSSSSSVLSEKAKDVSDVVEEEPITLGVLQTEEQVQRIEKENPY